jgi:hypothetical protein
MLQEHLTDWAKVLRYSDILHGREEKAFFFAMMALVSEQAQEIDHLCQIGPVYFLSVPDKLRHSIEYPQPEQNAFVLISEILARKSHRRHLLAQCRCSNTGSYFVEQTQRTFCSLQTPCRAFLAASAVKTAGGKN